MNNLPKSFLVKESKIKKVLKILSHFDVVFKGGTSLSLTHNIIHRFSEDLDISFYLEKEKDNKVERKKIYEEIFNKLKSEKWITKIDKNKEGFFLIHFENEAKKSEYDYAINPKTILLEIQDPERTRTKMHASKIKPFKDDDFQITSQNHLILS